MGEIAERSGQVNLLGLSVTVEGILATIDGRLEEAVEISRHTRAICEEIGMDIYGIVLELIQPPDPDVQV